MTQSFFDSHTCKPLTGYRVGRLLLLAALVSACSDGGQDPAMDDPATNDDPADDDPTVKGAALDVHLHLASQELVDAMFGGGVPAPTAEELVMLLDEGSVAKGIVLAPGYFHFLPDATYMAAENDYVESEIAKYPDRLMGFCGINPLLEGAV